MRLLTCLVCACLIAASAWAAEKVDPATGATSDGVSSVTTNTVTLEIPGLLDLDALQKELDGLYAEAEFLKYAGRDDVAVWNRINEILATLEPRDTEAALDEGGETWDASTVIYSLPYCDSGNTNDNVNNYGAPTPDCSPSPPGARGNDVVYVYYTGAEDEVVSISLCGSSYDTYLHVYRNNPPATGSAAYACNDDHAGTCPGGTNSLRSCIPNLTLTATDTFWIVVDGWNSTSNGSYQLFMDHDIRCAGCPPPPPCVECPAGAFVSAEPTCFNGYVDQTNVGCVAGAAPILENISCNTTICGTAGSYLSPTGQPRNDNDWYRLNVTAAEDSLNICFKAVAGGAWALYHIVGPNPCTNGADAVLVGQGNFPACQMVCANGCVEPGEYWLGIALNNGTLCGSQYRIDITCLWCGNEPTGRCCYTTPNGDFCQDAITAAACAELGGDWLEGASCTSAPCTPPTGRCCYVTDAAGPACENDVTRDWCAAVQGAWAEGETCESACCLTDYCALPIIVPGVLQYTHTENTCCATDATWCVGENGCNSTSCYAAGGAIIYKIVLASNGTLDLYASGPTDNQLMVFTDCNDPQGTCVASADNATDNVGNIYQGATEQILGLNLPAGTYYVATSTFFWTENPCGPSTLTIISDVELPAELTSFDAVSGDKKIALNWTTGSETNLDHFSLLRDGSLIAEVDANNSATGGNYSWTDNSLTNGRTYDYTLVSVDFGGASNTLGTLSAAPNAGSAIVTEYALYQNFPNPFNPETSISFDLVENGPVKLSVYNSLGQSVAVLVDGMETAGRHTVSFDGSALTSGLYFYRLDAGNFTAIHKMVLMK